MKYIIIVNNPEKMYRGRSPYTSAVIQTTPQETREWSMNRTEWIQYQGWYGVDTQGEAMMLAEKLAQAFPTLEVHVSKVECIFQSEKPKVAKKVITAQGALPS